MWVGELLGIGPSNVGFTLFAATAFVLCLAVATVLFSSALLFEVSIFLTALSNGSSTRRNKRIGLFLLSLFSFFSTYTAGTTALQLPGSRIGDVMLAAIAFEFDASPAEHCVLDKAEMTLAKRSEPVIKAIHLSTSQEKALIVKRSQALFRPVVLHGFSSAPAKDRRLDTVQLAECFKP